MRKLGLFVLVSVVLLFISNVASAQKKEILKNDFIPFLNKSLKFVKKGKCHKIDPEALNNYLDYVSAHNIIPEEDSLISKIARSLRTKSCKEGKTALLLELFHAHTLFQKADFPSSHKQFDKIYQKVESKYADDLPLKANVLHTYSLLKKILHHPDAYNYMVSTRKIYETLGQTEKISEYIFDISEFLIFENPMLVLDMVDYVEMLNNEKSSNAFFVKIHLLKGKANLMIGNFSLAQKHYSTSFKYARIDKDFNSGEFFKTRSSLVRLYSFMRQTDSIQKYLPYMEEAYKKIDKPSFDEKVAYLGLLSKSLETRQLFDSALYYRKKLLKILKKNLPENNHQVKGSYNALSSIYASAGQLEKGLKYANKVLLLEFPEDLDTADVEKTPPLSDNPKVNINAVLQNLMLKVFCLEELYKQTNDLKWLKLVVDHYHSMDYYVKKLQESVIEKNFLDLLKINQNGYDKAVVNLEKLYTETKNEKYLQELYFYSTALKGRLLAYQHYQLGLTMTDLSQNQLEYQNAYLKINQLKSELAIKKNKTAIQQLSDSVFDLHMQMSMLNKAIQLENAQRGNDFNVDKYHANIGSIMTAIDEETALVEYVIQQNVMRVFVITKEKFEYIPVPVNETFNREMSNFRRSIKTGGKLDNEGLSAFLIDPIKNHISSKNHLVIIPHDDLFAIPFEALLCDDELLLERHDVSYHYSGYFWLHSQKKTRLKENPSIALFAPVFDKNAEESIKSYASFRSFESVDSAMVSRSDNTLIPLPFSKVEVDNISKDFNKKNLEVSVFIHEKATEDAFRSIKNKDILHIATHGLSNLKQPEMSGLFFAKSGNIKNQDYTSDGFIHMNELYELNTEADLAVLSACKSGVGKVFRGEGFFGLPRGFILAGTNNVIASLWKIHDKKTEKLISRFYDYLLDGNNYSQSLKKAKLDMIKEGFLPMDWSGIVLIGK
jgi:CHAT domain-containing protein